MRWELVNYIGHPATFRGTVRRFGKEFNNAGTLLVVDIRTTEGHPVTDHLWFAVGKRLKAIKPRSGDALQFEAKASAYYRRSGKDIVGMDYKLVHIRKIQKVGS